MERAWQRPLFLLLSPRPRRPRPRPRRPRRPRHPWTLSRRRPPNPTLILNPHILSLVRSPNDDDYKIPPRTTRSPLPPPERKRRRMLFSVLTSSAVGLAGLLIAAPAHVNALVTPGSGSELGHLAARRLAGVSPNHHALARRKTNAHKKRQRCQQRPVSPSSTPAPQQTGTPNNVAADVYVGGDNNNNNPSNPTTTPPAPANTGTYTPPPAPATGDGKLILAWPNGAEQYVSEFFTGKARLYVTFSCTHLEIILTIPAATITGRHTRPLTPLAISSSAPCFGVTMTTSLQISEIS